MTPLSYYKGLFDKSSPWRDDGFSSMLICFYESWSPGAVFFCSFLLMFIEHDKPYFPGGSLNPCSFLPVLRGYSPRPAMAQGQKRYISIAMSSDSSSSGTRGTRPYFDGPNTPTHQESHHTPYHSTQGSPFTARRGCSLTPTTRPPPTHPPHLSQPKRVWFRCFFGEWTSS